ncbi:hypothetical protein ACWCSH_32255, partial [Streptosporangium sp. NPDC001682]
ARRAGVGGDSDGTVSRAFAVGDVDDDGRLSTDDTDWERMAALYRVLAHLAPSPVVELNRAVAVSRAYGPARGLEIVDGLAAERALRGYPQLPAVRGDLLVRLGRLDEAREEFERAAELTRNERERTLFLTRAAATHG